MSEVRLERQGPVGVVSLDAPHTRNAFTVAMVEDLIAACDAIDDDAAIGAVVLRAEGQSFCAGAHRALLDEAGRDPPNPENFAVLQPAVRVVSCSPCSVHHRPSRSSAEKPACPTEMRP